MIFNLVIREMTNFVWMPPPKLAKCSNTLPTIYCYNRAATFASQNDINWCQYNIHGAEDRDFNGMS